MMRSRWLAIFALLSATVGLVLLSGYVVRVSAARIGASGYLSFCSIGNGCIRFRTFPGTTLPPVACRFSVEWNDPPRSVWLTGFFYNHGGERVGGEVDLNLPIWCVLLPCLIAPIAWLRSRRRAGRGYPVEPLPAPQVL